MERTLVMHSKDQILADDLFIEFSCPVPPPVSIYPQAKTLADVEKHHILTTLRALGNNKTQAAKSLGISLRTLRNKLKVFH
jgi:transcriptional regulator with PAS, ATPase and Fis domain